MDRAWITPRSGDLLPGTKGEGPSVRRPPEIDRILPTTESRSPEELVRSLGIRACGRIFQRPYGVHRLLAIASL